MAETSIALVVGIGFVVVVVLGGLFFALAATRSGRRDVEGVGDLDSAARKRDKQRRKAEETQRAALDRAQIEAGAEPEGEFSAALAEIEAEAPAVGAEELARVDEGTTEVYAPSVREVPDPIEVGITRRQALNRSAIVGSLVGLGALGGASLAFLIPPPTKGFGGKITVPASIDDVKTEIESSRKPYYVAEARTYLETYRAEDEAEATRVYPLIAEAVKASGLMPLFQKCPHLGCRVPWCDSSQWFECPCHGSQYNKAGEKTAGPAPRGMDRFEFEVAGDSLVIDTGKIVEGPVIGTDTIAQAPEGEHCV